MKKFLLLFFLFLLILFFFYFKDHQKSYKAVNVSRQHHPERFLKSLKNDANVGEKIYLEFCAVCHQPDPPILIGAPATGIAQDWKNRSKTLKTLKESVINGLNAMPARGGCFECSDAQLEAAIHYMMSNQEEE